MIQIEINGEEREVEEAVALTELLKTLRIRATAIAVALNSEVIPHSELGRTVVRDRDRIEIIHPVGGG